TGKLPFAGESQIDVLIRVCNENEPILAPSSVAPDLGPGVDRFFARALARPPGARFQSAREFAEAMTALASCTSGTAMKTAPFPAGRGPQQPAPAPHNAPAPPVRVIVASTPPASPASPRPSARGMHPAPPVVYNSANVPSTPRAPVAAAAPI